MEVETRGRAPVAKTGEPTTEVPAFARTGAEAAAKYAAYLREEHLAGLGTPDGS